MYGFTFVCVCEHLCTCGVIYVCVYMCSGAFCGRFLCASLCVCIFVYVHVCACGFMHVGIMYMFVGAVVCIFVCVYVSLYARVGLCMFWGKIYGCLCARCHCRVQNIA